MKANVMTIPNVMKQVYTVIGNNKKEKKTQDPDQINLHKQWSEFGQFKGYWVDVIYKGKKKDLTISLDCTRGYTRVMGSIEKIPLFTPGKHNFV